MNLYLFKVAIFHTFMREKAIFRDIFIDKFNKVLISTTKLKIIDLDTTCVNIKIPHRVK